MSASPVRNNLAPSICPRADAVPAGAARAVCGAAEYASPVFAARTFVARVSCFMIIAYHVELRKWEMAQKLIEFFPICAYLKAIKFCKTFTM
jgi:hypothetical protein